MPIVWNITDFLSYILEEILFHICIMCLEKYPTCITPSWWTLMHLDLLPEEEKKMKNKGRAGVDRRKKWVAYVHCVISFRLCVSFKIWECYSELGMLSSLTPLFFGFVADLNPLLKTKEHMASFMNSPFCFSSFTYTDLQILPKLTQTRPLSCSFGDCPSVML